MIEISGPGSDRAMVGGAYDGASRTDRAVALWSPPLQSADRDTLPEKEIADGRAADMLRNDAYVAAGQTIQKDTIVGAMYVLSAKPIAKALGLDEKWEQEFQEEVETKFTLAAESPMCWLDAARRNTFTDIVRLGVGVYLAAGEYLATAEWIRDPSRPFRTAIQAVDVARLSTPAGRTEDSRLRAGVQMDRYGAPEGYHIRLAHPRDYFDPNSYQWKFVPARKPWGRPQVIHIMEQQRVDQTRGISEMVSALSEMKITKQFRKIVLQNAVVNASFAAAIESDMPPEAAYAALGNDASAISNFGTAYLSAIGEYAGAARNLTIDGVKIPHLYPGTKLKLLHAGQPGGVGTEFETSLLRYIAANLGVSYEQLSKDWSQSNYSSAKAGLNETSKHMRARKRIVADKLANIIYRLWLEEAINSGEITSLPRNAPSFYEGLNADAYSRAEWIGASFGQIDELKETQAAVLRLKSNLSTHEDELARMGKDWRQVFRQREREKADMEARGLIMEEDNSINAASGAPRTKEPAGGSDGNTPSKGEADNSAFEAMAAIAQSLATREPPAPVAAPDVHVTNVHLDEVKSVVSGLKDVATGMEAVAKKMKQKTTTRIVEHDEKGRILRTETEPVPDDN